MISRLKAFLRLYFGVSRKEANGLVILIPLTVSLVFLPPIIRDILSDTTNDSSDEKFTQQMVDRIRKLSHKKPEMAKNSQSRTIVELFDFDPNSVGREDLLRLGLSTKQAQNIINYRSKGGQFRVKNDLAKIYSISQEEFNQLKPFIDLPDKIVYPRMDDNKGHSAKQATPEIAIKDLNSATTDDLQEIRGIGEVLSKRIVKFRDALGGFHSISQLREVYGLSDSVRMKVEDRFEVTESGKLTKLRLDTCTAAELARHPYITNKLARIVEKYREQHSLDSIEQLLEIKIISDSLFQKLKPYLAIGQ